MRAERRPGKPINFQNAKPGLNHGRDNVAKNGPYSSLNSERVTRKTYLNRDEAPADVCDYIERFYNP